MSRVDRFNPQPEAIILVLVKRESSCSAFLSFGTINPLLPIPHKAPVLRGILVKPGPVHAAVDVHSLRDG